MISVETARDHLFALVSALGGEPETEEVPLTQAAGRVLARPLAATRTQPPFAASAMDGYAVAASDVQPGAHFKVIGEAAAGHAFGATLAQGQALRIFTGAPLPEGADHVVIQEDVTRQGDTITLASDLETKPHVRPAGADFTKGTRLEAPLRLGPADIALLAAMGHGNVPVTCRPKVAIIATGDELVTPGEAPADDQIIASNSYGLHAMLAAAGAEPRLLPIARDNEASLRQSFELAAGADLIVTIGGASVGDHDLVGPVARALGLEQSFYKIAMRPGKPLMAGRLGPAIMVGLPGNPVSALVCGQLFLLPMINGMLGLPMEAPRTQRAPLAQPIAANGPREHYMRARLEGGEVTVFDRQDSALLTVLARANALVVRPPNDPACAAGTLVDYLPI